MAKRSQRLSRLAQPIASAGLLDDHASRAGREGDAFLARFTEALYQKGMRDREAQLNHCLTTGERPRL